MERVSVVVVCDRCGVDTGLEAGSGLLIKFGSLAADVDLCEDCHKYLLNELEGVLDKGRVGGTLTGQRARRERKDALRVLCPDCGKYYHEGAGIKLHRMKKHGEGAGSGNAEGTG